eukprot:Sspe_Gene.55213::Locus_30394_Transcript_1_1_Confidence_1.000_Length_2012::g.55213::m.55213
MCGNWRMYFSTPLVKDNGATIGFPDTHDMARVWRERAPMLSARMKHRVPFAGEAPAPAGRGLRLRHAGTVEASYLYAPPGGTALRCQPLRGTGMAKEDYIASGTFQAVRGLWGTGTVSLKLPGNRYLRHSGFVLRAEPDSRSELYRKDASFRPVERTLPDGRVAWAFESENFRGYYVVLSGVEVRIVRRSQEEAAMWIETAPLVGLSVRLREAAGARRFLYATGSEVRHTSVPLGPSSTFEVVAGLAAGPRTVSLRIGDRFLRHRNFVMSADTASTDWIFDLDASFVPVSRELPNGGTVWAFEAVNFGGYFLSRSGAGASILPVHSDEEVPFWELSIP